MKPRMFIGSSTEARSLAYALQSLLEPDANPVIWDQGVFNLSATALQDLVSSLDSFDYGVFLFSPDDVITIRSADVLAPRDNVIFEFGMFMGRLGAPRTFIVAPRLADLRIPTDLLGFTRATFDPKNENLKAALGPASNQIVEQIKKSFLPKPGLYINSEFNHPIGDGWRLYTGNRASFSVSTEEVRLGDTDNTGFEYPFFGVSRPFRYALFRIRRPTSTTPVSIYIAFDDRGTFTHISASTNLRRYGWGLPMNEFCIPLRSIPADGWYPVFLDIENIHSSLNGPGIVTSFKLRAPISISHIWCAEQLDDIPETVRRWRTRLVDPISIPTTLPAIEILSPTQGERVQRKHIVWGVVADTSMHVATYVHAPDRYWYRQQNAATHGRYWSAECVFGDDNSKTGDEFRLIAIATKGPVDDLEPARELPKIGQRSEQIMVLRA